VNVNYSDRKYRYRYVIKRISRLLVAVSYVFVIFSSFLNQYKSVLLDRN